MENKLEHIRHSLAHLLGASILELYPGSQITLGPAVDNGFYYDVDIKGKVTDDDLEMTGMVYGSYFNSPEEVPEEELEYEIGFSFDGALKLQEGKLGFKEIPEHSVLASIHKGPYTNVGPVIHAIAEYASKNGYDIVGPVTEVYLNNPNDVKQEDLLTEVRFPVIKMR